MDAPASTGSLASRLQALVRERARAGLDRDELRAGRMLARVLASPLPLPPLDVAALELALGLAEVASLNPDRARRLIEAAMARGAAPVAVVGDSHSTHLIRRSVREGRWLLPLHLLCTGASARGLANPAAAAGAGHRVRAFLAGLAETAVPVVFKFGQVDVEFVHTFKRLEAGQSRFDEAEFDAFADETVARYLGFLAEAAPETLRPRAWVAGIFPPALSDAAWRQGYVDAHIADLHGPADRSVLTERLSGLEIPTLFNRTRLHARFNAKLTEAAEGVGFHVLDPFKALLGPGGVLDWGLLGRARGANHHLGYAASRKPLLGAVWEVAATVGSPPSEGSTSEGRDGS